MPISQKPYIGTRDFFPEDMQFRNWMFEKQKSVCERFSYKNYACPILEPLDLYRAKSSDEIVSEQVYSFHDRGDREVAIRPELTPSLARMISSKFQHLNLPERWYNIGNFMRYERPGRGRLREFWQLNVDLLGSSGPFAEVEVLQLAIELFTTYGATHKHFQVRYSDRRLMESCLHTSDNDQFRNICRLIDKKEKITDVAFSTELKSLCANDNSLEKQIYEFLTYEISDLERLANEGTIDKSVASDLLSLSSTMADLGYADYLKFDPTIARGFDYYTGFVFEVNDLDPQNNRALLGGGRYDKLIGLFGKNGLPAVGFGMGDVTLENFIRSHNLCDIDFNKRQGAFITLMSENLLPDCLKMGTEIRKLGIAVENSLVITKKFGKQLQSADKKRCRFVVIFGENEKADGVVQLKDLEKSTQIQVKTELLVSEIQNLL